MSTSLLRLAANANADAPPGEPELRLITGAPAIAAALGVTPRQVHAIREAADRAKAKGEPHDCPIGRVPGLGLAARRATLDAWLTRHGVI